jgi:hypothetical protein
MPPQNGTATGGYTSDQWVDFTVTLAFIFEGWTRGNDVATLLDRAQQRDPVGDGSVILHLPYGGLRGVLSDYKLRYFGYKFLTRAGYALPHQ